HTFKALRAVHSAQGLLHGPHTDTQVTTLRLKGGPSRDNGTVTSHPKDRPWTTRFLLSKNVKRSTQVAGFHLSHLLYATTFSDVHTSNASRTAASSPHAAIRPRSGSRAPGALCG